MTFASGRYAIAICDICGMQYPYKSLRIQWNGIFACPECWSPKEPQLDPPYHAADPQALFNPRPESNKILEAQLPAGPNEANTSTFGQPMPVTVFVGDPGMSAFLTTVQGTSPSDGSDPTTSSSMLPQTPEQKLTISPQLGTVTVVIS
jgi:hypothetical protein